MFRNLIYRFVALLRALLSGMNDRTHSLIGLFTERKLIVPPKTVVIVIGQLRSEQILDSLATALQNELLLIGHFDKAPSKAVTERFHSIIIDDFANTPRNKNGVTLPLGIIQWLRVSDCIERLKTFEEYSNAAQILKLRTDGEIVKVSGLEKLSVNSDEVFVQRDFSIYAKKAIFEELVDFPKYLVNECDIVGKYRKLNYDAQLSSDWNSCSLDCLWYPEKIVGTPFNIGQLKSRIALNLMQLKLYNHESTDNLFSFNPTQRLFSSEADFPAYFLGKSVKIRNLAPYLKVKLPRNRKKWNTDG